MEKIYKQLLQKVYFHWPVVVSVIGILWLYSPIVKMFYEQDEWHTFGWQSYSMAEYGTLAHVLKLIQTSLPVAQLFNFINYYVFGIDTVFPALTVLFLVLLNTILWYSNWYMLTKSRLIAVGSVIFGYTSFLSMQSVSWVVPAFSTQGSFLFINLTLLCLHAYLLHVHWKYILGMLLGIVLAVFTKQNSFFLIFYLPLVYIVLQPRQWSRHFIKRSLLLMMACSVFAVGFFWIKLGSIEFGYSRYTSSPLQVVANAVYLPVKSISQLLLPNPAHMYAYVDWLVQSRYRIHDDGVYKQQVMVEQVSFSASLWLIIGFILLLPFLKKRHKILFLASSFYYLSFSPFFIDIFSTGTGFLESRYYYVSAFGLGIIVMVILEYLLHVLQKIPVRVVARGALLGLFFVMGAYVWYASWLISNQLERSIQLTQKRKEILQDLVQALDGKEKVVLYVRDVYHDTVLDNNNTGRYFQTGLLYPTLVYAEYFSPYFFATDELWDYTFQGIKTINTQTVGIYYDTKLLQEAHQQELLDVEDIIGIVVDYSNTEEHPEYVGNMYDLRWVTHSILDAEQIQAIIGDNDE